MKISAMAGFLCSTLLLSGCIYHTGALRKQVGNYAGDGAIIDTSLAAPLLFQSPGFRIVLPAFDASHPCEKSYNLGNVPKIKDQKSMIYVRFVGDYSSDLDQIKQRTTSILSFKITDGSGTTLKSLEIPFKNKHTIWSSGGNEFGLWVESDDPNSYSEENVFYFDPAKHYTLHITYTPGDFPPKTDKMWITIENGGII